MRSILVVSNRSQDTFDIAGALNKEYRIDHCGSHADALKILHKRQHQIIFIDLDTLETISEDQLNERLEALAELSLLVYIVIIVPSNNLRMAFKALRGSANDFILFPIDADEVRGIIDFAEAYILKSQELDYLRDKFWRHDVVKLVRSNSPEMRKVLEKVRSVAKTNATVLILGETGTGKSVLAKVIHQHSNRGDAPFISVHCGAIPDTLLESELFGHEKGAFTGAIRKKLGKFEIAKGGTIFLDEIGTISASAQVKLLQVLQDGNFSRVGGDHMLETDARLIVATNADIEKLSKVGQFRKDLFYRLNVFPIQMPPLRNRIEDIGIFIDLFLKRFNNKHGKKIQFVSPRVLSAFKRYDWPGNIRELENLLERAYVLAATQTLMPDSFPSELFGNNVIQPFLSQDMHLSLAEARRLAVEEFEREYLKELLSRNQGKVNQSANEAGITTRQLNKLMQKYTFIVIYFTFRKIIFGFYFIK